MLRLPILFFFLSIFSQSFSQAKMPPLIEIIAENQKMSMNDLTGSFRYTVDNIKSGERKQALSENEVNFKDDPFTRILADRIFISLNDSVNKAFPQKGSVIGLYLQNKTTNEIMRIFIRICKDLYYNVRISLKDLKFIKGSYFYDMCSSEKRYEINYTYLCPHRTQKNNYGINPFLELEDYATHLVTLKKLKKIIKKNKCD
jgi:hypothetical protein